MEKSLKKCLDNSEVEQNCYFTYLSYLFNILKNFLFVRGLTLESNSSFICNSTDDFNFSKWHFETKLNTKFKLFPHFGTRSNYRKKLVYVLQNNHISQSLKIKMVTFLLHSWYKHHHFCSRSKLQLQFFYLKRLLDNYKYVFSTFSKNHLINQDVK